MTQKEIKNRIMDMAENSYAEFSSALIPGAPKMYGVRIPALRKFAKEIAAGDWNVYLEEATEDSFEETMLQGLVIGYVNTDLETRLQLLETFVPKINNWSVNDSVAATMKFAIKNRERVWDFLQQYLMSEREFEIRFGVIMLMDHYLTPEYIGKVLDAWNRVKQGDYYVDMGVAWGLATAYAKFPKETEDFLQTCTLSKDILHMAARKMVESYRIPKEAKEKMKERYYKKK